MAERRALHFFSEESVLERFKAPSSYFDKIPTVAHKSVFFSYNRDYLIFDIFSIMQKTIGEEKVTLAFSILCHGNIGLLEALMASIFRPQNIYCIYVDDKAPTEYKKAVRQLAGIYLYHFPEVTHI